ncbi:glycosyl transferase [Leptospira perolatii]|uniref:Glycosyl transferase n=1 Tax=Leptospira perolatii TaxID=2023191 RepID=A0A2M9ZJ31_9LEPT|nr:glycosyl transferase [Leptospira perolatii]PJZ72066.1 glycosyl transferase [Leptospira perolatii]
MIYSAFLLLGLGAFPLIDWDENIYGTASKEMFFSGNYFRTTVNGQLFIEKPPLYFWLANLAYEIFGINEFATRIPSVLSAVISFAALVLFGKKHFGLKFGLIWALIYSSSLLPLVLARTAYIDHLFNTFILLGFLSLFEYDFEFPEGGKEARRWLVAAGFFTALAVLAKGPLGLVMPVISVFGMRLLGKRFRIPIVDLLLFAISFLSFVSIYYLTNYLLYGKEFLLGFIDFQNKLLTKSLESHTGPWFYHLIVVIFGFFPWTPFLVYYFSKQVRSKIFEIGTEEGTKNPAQRLAFGMATWAAFVFLVFSFVQTKLPHYSASVYFPLSFFTAILVYRFGEEFLQERKLRFALSLGAIVIGGLFASIPFFAGYLHQSIPDFTGNFPHFNFYDSIPGILLGVGISLVCILFVKTKKSDLVTRFILPTWAVLQIFLVSLSVTAVPKIIDLLQSKTLRLFDTAISQNGKVIFYKYLSFYPMFYRKEKIHIIGSYKFQDESELLKKRELENTFILCNRNSLLELQLIYPNRKFETISQEGDLILLRVD